MTEPLKTFSGRKASQRPEELHAFTHELFRQNDHLCIAFSDDDAKTWSKPAVIMRHPGKMLSYPYIFERAPGEIWVATFFGEPHASVNLNDADFLPRP